MSREIQQKMARGALWMVLFKFTERSLGLISTLILVRLLSPADFGFVGMAGSFILLTEMLTAVAFDVALIQKQDATDEHYHSAWTCNVFLGCFITMLMLVASTAIASFYKQPDLVWVVCALAFGPLIAGCENIGVVAFRKEMRFDREFSFQLIRKLLGFMVVVPLAYFTHSYWALVAGILTAKLAGTVSSYLMHPFRPRFCLNKARGLFGFSKWLLLNNMVSYLKERSSDFIIGRTMGPAPLGLYDVSYEIAIMPTTELSAPINRALMPGFSKIAGDPIALRAAYGNAMGILALVALPAAAGIYALAPYIVPVLLGQKWLAGVPLMELLAFHGGLLLFHSSICTVLIANGHPDRVTKTNAIYVAVLLCMFGLLIPPYGLTGAALAALATSIVGTPFYLFQIRRSLGVPASDFVRAAIRPALAAAVMAGLLRWLLPEWTPDLKFSVALGWTVTGVTTGVFTYATAIVLLWTAAGRPNGAEKALFEKIRERFAKSTTANNSTLLP